MLRTLKKALPKKLKKWLKRRYLKLQCHYFNGKTAYLRKVDLFLAQRKSSRYFVFFATRIPRSYYFISAIALLFPFLTMTLLAQLHRQDPLRRPYAHFVNMVGVRVLNRFLFVQTNESSIKKIQAVLSNVVELEYLTLSFMKALHKSHKVWIKFFRSQLFYAIEQEAYSEEQLYNCLLRLAQLLPQAEMSLLLSQVPSSIQDKYFLFVGPIGKLEVLGSKRDDGTHLKSLSDVKAVSGYKFYKGQFVLENDINTDLISQYSFGDVFVLKDNRVFVFLKFDRSKEVVVDEALLLPELRKGFFYFFLDRVLRLVAFELENANKNLPVYYQTKLDWETKFIFKELFPEKTFVEASRGTHLYVKKAHFVMHEDFDHTAEAAYTVEPKIKDYLINKISSEESLKMKFLNKKIALAFPFDLRAQVLDAQELMEKEGFEFYDESKLSLLERLAIFSFADQVVMPVSSQLSLLMFLGERTRLYICSTKTGSDTLKQNLFPSEKKWEHVVHLEMTNLKEEVSAKVMRPVVPKSRKEEVLHA